MLLDKNEASRGPLRFALFLGRLVDKWLWTLDKCFLLIKVRDCYWSPGRCEEVAGGTFVRTDGFTSDTGDWVHTPHQVGRRSAKPEFITQPVVDWRDRTKVPALPKKFSVSHTLGKGLVRSWC